MIWYVIGLLGGCVIAAVLLLVLEPKALIRFLIFLTKLVGNMAALLSRCQSALGRTQIRLFTIAQFKGWKPATEEESDRLVHRQFKLFLWRTEKAIEKKRKRGVPILAKQPPTNQTGNNL